MKNKKMWFMLVVLIITCLVVALLLVRRNESQDNSESDKSVSTTSNESSARADFDEGSDENKNTPGNTLPEQQGTAEIIDNGGAPSTDRSKSVTSATGDITLYLPAKNSVVKSGQEVSGSTSLSEVSYRVIDSVSGVIATGTLSVVNGNFSGTLSFITGAKEGRLDIFATKADGVEFSNIEIPVRF